MQTPSIRQLPAKTLVGLAMRMQLTADLTPSLWRSFMPRRGEVAHVVGQDFYSVQVYPATYFSRFDPTRFFEKWAAVEVAAVDALPEGMACFTIPAGSYAVFHHQGPGGDPSIFQYIFGTWLPTSGYALADRPHFELLPPDYQATSPDASEEIWVPIQPKQA